MKHFARALLLVLTASGLLTGCVGYKNDIVGTWELVSEIVRENVSGFSRDRVTEPEASVTVSFGTDKGFKALVARHEGMESVTGSYRISGIRLILTPDGSKSKSERLHFTIKSLNDDELVLHFVWSDYRSVDEKTIDDPTVSSRFTFARK